MLFGFSNLIPISAELQQQKEQLKTNGPAGPACSAPRPVDAGASLLTESGATQIGHWKQLLVHLQAV